MVPGFSSRTCHVFCDAYVSIIPTCCNKGLRDSLSRGMVVNETRLSTPLRVVLLGCSDTCRHALVFANQAYFLVREQCTRMLETRSSPSQPLHPRRVTTAATQQALSRVSVPRASNPSHFPHSKARPRSRRRRSSLDQWTLRWSPQRVGI